MTKDDRTTAGASSRPLRWLGVVLLASFVIGAAVSPPIYNGLIHLGRNVAALEGLRELEFERVTSRAVMVTAILLMVLTIRRSGLRGLCDAGYPGRKGWAAVVAKGFGLGFVSMASLAVVGVAMHAYGVVENWPGVLARTLAGALVGALLIGFIEEGFFRGVLFGALRSRMGFWGGALVSSLIFSLAHFIKPEALDGIVHARWYSGFALARHLFVRLDFSWNSFPFSLNLFVMGLVLCAFCRVRRDVYFAAGLHAGWVWVLQAATRVFERDPETHLWLFGPSELVSKGYLALITLTLFLVAALLVQRPGAGGDA